MEKHDYLVNTSEQMHSDKHGYSLMDPAAQKQLANLEKSIDAVARVFLSLGERMNVLESIVQNQITITGAEACTLHESIIFRAHEFCDGSHVSYRLAGRKVRKAITHDFLHEFSLSDYHDLPKKSFPSGLEFIRNWRSFAMAKKLRQLYEGGGENG